MHKTLSRWLTAAAATLLLPLVQAGEPLATTAAEYRTLPREYRLDGSVEAVHQTTVSAQTSGQVEEVLFDVDKGHRERKSRELALAVREPVQSIARRYGGNAKIVEVPPGPPVMSPLVAEIHGIDHAGQNQTAKQVREGMDLQEAVIQSAAFSGCPAVDIRVHRGRST